MPIVLGADIFDPDRLRSGIAAIGPPHRPGTRQGVVHGGDLVVQRVGVGVVERDPLLDDAHAVLMQRNATTVEAARALEGARLDDERVVSSRLLRIEPLADGVAEERRREARRPIAAVSKDAARPAVRALDEGSLRSDDELERQNADHVAWHAVRQALVARIGALPAARLIGEARLKHRLIFGRERRALPQPGRPGRIPIAAANPAPLAAPVRIGRGIRRPRMTGRQHQG